MKKLFQPFTSQALQLDNHIAMAPMTRSRAVHNLPNELMATYYKQRSGAGLIITEGTSPSPNGLGYTNIPAIYNQEQIEGWKKSTEAVHQQGGKIFLQIMHTGRVASSLNLPKGGEVIAPSAIQAAGEMFTFQGMQPHDVPRAMTLEDIKQTQEEYVQAARNAIEAGFDGVEIHAANGYLPNQFLNPRSNQRTDDYGGSVHNRTRFVLEIVEQTVKTIGADKVGLRISPYGVFNDMAVYDLIPETYQHLVDHMDQFNLAYLHLLDVAALGGEAPQGFLLNLVKNYHGTVMFNGGLAFHLDKAEDLVNMKDNYLISIGAPYISNPDLVHRLKNGHELAAPDQSTFYSPGAEGYTDYPTM